MEDDPSCTDVTSDATFQETKEEESATFSESAIHELVHLLVKKGYFHNGDHDGPAVTEKEPKPVMLQENDQDVDDSYEAFTRQQQHEKKKVQLLSTLDATCQLVVTRDGGAYMTRSYMARRLQEELQNRGGRLSLDDAATLLKVDLIHVQRAVTEELLKPDNNDIQQVGNDLIHASHLDQLTQTAKELLQTKGQLSLSELSNQIFHLPLELTLRLVTERLVESNAANTAPALLVTTSSGAKMVVAPAHWEALRDQMYQTLLHATEPTSLTLVCQETLGWSVESCNSLVLPWLRTLITRTKGDDDTPSSNDQETIKLTGELHESGSVQGAMYIPSSHIQSQRQAVDDFFVTNGYVMVDQCKTFGLRPSKLHDFVKESFPQAIAVPDAVLHPDVLLTPLEAVLQEAVDNDDTLVDLSLHLPSALLSHIPVCHAIVHDWVLTKLAQRVGKDVSELGLCVITHQEAHFYCHGLVERIRRSLLPGVMEQFAKRKAEELDELESPSRTAKASSGAAEGESKGKEKRKGKKAQRETSKASTASESDSLFVPLMEVAAAISNEFPIFAELLEESSSSSSSSQAPQWEASEENEAEWVSGGPLCEFCRVALYTEDVRKSCQQSVEVELKRLRSKRESKASVVSRKDAASKIRSVEQSFEDPSCFAAACYLLQLRTKGLAFLATAGLHPTALAELERDFLQTCCADFASRVTQYYLFKQGADDGLFSFTATDEQLTQPEETDVPVFCRPVDLAMRNYPKVYLSSCQQQDGGLGRLPLSTLRDEGSVGVQLARMWNFCGGHCFQGGTRLAEDGTDITKPGNVEEFLAHVEENCLMICGLPFKKLDKKSEKSTLFARRQALTRLLERAESPDDVLELTIMLLFQQVKNIVVCGNHLPGAVLDLLRKEKKIPEDVGSVLGNLVEKIANGDSVGSELVDAVRACGLSRDIAKHAVN